MPPLNFDPVSNKSGTISSSTLIPTFCCNLLEMVVFSVSKVPDVGSEGRSDHQGTWRRRWTVRRPKRRTLTLTPCLRCRSAGPTCTVSSLTVSTAREILTNTTVSSKQKQAETKWSSDLLKVQAANVNVLMWVRYEQLLITRIDYWSATFQHQNCKKVQIRHWEKETLNSDTNELLKT